VGHFQAVYYRDPESFEPVRDFVDALPEQTQAAVENQIARLNLLSDEIPHLPFPHTSQVEGELRESCAATTDGASTESCTDARGDW
jgi:hypothetical protein